MQARTALPYLALIFALSPVTAAMARPASDEPSTAEKLRLVAEFTDCVTAQKSRQPAIQAFLRTIPDRPGFGEAGLKAADLSCLNRAAVRMHSKIEMRLQPESFRNALFPSLYRREFGKAGPVADFKTVPPLRLSEEFDGDTAELPGDFIAGRLFGDCVAREDAADAHAMLLAQPTSPEESAAIDRLKPAFTACIKQDQTVSITRAAVRATVGEAMLKLSRAARAG
ncbi:hypothetical protein [Sphingomonas elodea]|uniref:hypothetical protein n=1 Tax=Sphingomonas elodea TaxID=179878 RepID=UPI00026306CF|nr:hypothetical protein [Sphingomonas elodea]